MYPWQHWRTLVPLSVGTAGLVAFVIYSKYIPRFPLLRRTLFQSTSLLAAYFGTMVCGMVIWGAIYYIPYYFQVCKGWNHVEAASGTLIWSTTIAPAAMVAGFVIATRGRYMWAVLSGAALTVAGVAHFPAFNVETPTANWVSLLIISGFGLGLLYTGLSITIQAAVSPRDLPDAASLFTFFDKLGQTVGVAFGGTIFQNAMRQQLLRSPILKDQATALSKEASALVEIIRTVPLSRPALAALIESYVIALRWFWIGMVCFTVLALALLVLFAKEVNLRPKLPASTSSTQLMGDRPPSLPYPEPIGPLFMDSGRSSPYRWRYHNDDDLYSMLPRKLEGIA